MAILGITVPDEAVTRIRNAVAASMGVAAPATTAQVSDFVRAYLRSLCVQVEYTQRSQTRDAETQEISVDSEIAVAVDFPPEP